MTTAKSCQQCGAELALARLEPMRGEESGVELSIEGMPAYACVKGHKRFLTPDFPMRMIDSLAKAETPDLPVAHKKGLLKKRYLCPGCGGELPQDAGTHATLERSLALKDSAPFNATVAVPLYRCGGCGVAAMRPGNEMTDALMRAAAQAFQSAGIPPG
ncbi:MAG: hypothetical protein R3357_12375 [Burkholderiales bacterium]|nr:hypothetical protein [Burkholderiales bacterium]